MFYQIASVQACADYTLLVAFRNGEQKLYDVKPLFSKYPAFGALKTIAGLFEQVKVDIGGYGIVWNDELDLSCNELYEQGVDCALV